MSVKVANSSDGGDRLDDRVAVERAEQGTHEGRVIGPGGRGHGHDGPGGVVVGLLVVDLGQLGHQLVGGQHRVAGRSGEPGRAGSEAKAVIGRPVPVDER